MRSDQLSLEFFPPKTSEGQEKLKQTFLQLKALNPAFCSVTFGAGGSTQEGTIETIQTLLKLGVDAAPHLSCMGTSREQINGLLAQYQSLGVKRLVALRGDFPSGMGHEAGDFAYASELVAYIRHHFGESFHLEVAAYPEAHPQSKNAQDDLDHFITKVNQGANSAITQYFFNPDAYFYFVESVRAKGVNIPIVPGIMPITNFVQLKRFSDACGAEIPRWIEKKLLSFGDDKTAMSQFGTEYITKMCEKLIAGGAPALHFYTLNHVNPTLTICQNLGF